MYLVMGLELQNWKTQMRKGYLELCLLLIIRKNESIYGFDILDKFRQMNFELKEGTLYPMLNRMTSDGILQAKWQTDNLKGHPRKFYTITKHGNTLLETMAQEFTAMVQHFEELL